MSEFKGYARKGEIKLRPVTQEEIELGSDNLIEKVGVSISPEDVVAGSPKEGDMIAVNPENNLDLWLVNKEYFEKNYSLLEKCSEKGCDIVVVEPEQVGKTYHNTDASGAKENVSDIVFFGDGDTFKLICKASSQKEGWMKSTKAMEIEGVGCVVQVTTQQWSNIAEALTFVPNVKIEEIKDENGMVMSRKLISITLS